MKGYIFITSSGTDPMAGNHLKDPTLDKVATFGACQPQIRKRLEREDYLFVVSGSMRSHGLNQYIVGGLQVDEKVHAKEAYSRLPGQRLHHLEDGQISGNVICDANGKPHELDEHSSYSKRLENYIIGKNAIVLKSPEEVEKGREQTMNILRQLFHRDGRIPRDVIGRCSRMSADQIEELLYHLRILKSH